MTELHAGHPVEPQWYPVGRRSTVLVDRSRDGRALGVECWYPAVDGAATDGVPSRYELMPGVSFRSAGALHEPVTRAGRHPLVLFSHGRTGMRFVAGMLCEALAARGAVVISADHPGDALFDWLLGTQSDDRTNEVNRVGDAHFLLDSVLRGAEGIPVDLANAVDPHRIALAGHSYGAYTAFATAAGARGVASHPKVRAVIGYQPYTRTMSDALLGRLDVPTLMVVGTADTTTPAATDVDRPWATLGAPVVWRLDIEGATHQASTDVALYAELVHHLADVPDAPPVPEVVRAYLDESAAGCAVVGGRSWRDVIRLQVETTWAFLQVALEIDEEAGEESFALLGATPGLVMLRR